MSGDHLDEQRFTAAGYPHDQHPFGHLCAGRNVIQTECLFTTIQPVFEVFHPAEMVRIGIIDDKLHDAAFSDDLLFGLKERLNDFAAAADLRLIESADATLDVR